jgi:hypothetical protein
MRKLTVINHMTLDGVMQAPGRPDEDTRGGFSRGGWAQAGNDEVMASFMAAGQGGDPMALILGGGRRLFPEGTPAGLHLAQTVSTTTGVIIARYQVR